MGFFERHLSTVGEAMDEGIDRARDRTRDLCDRSGWGDRAESWRDRARERWEAGARGAHLQWRDLGEKGRRRTLMVGALSALLLALLVLRSLAFRDVPLPTSDEMELIAGARTQSQSAGAWVVRPSGATPWEPNGR